jgi:peptidoglycan/xylan/chitin deacetylase (PgdA/CDA1 family)
MLLTFDDCYEDLLAAGLPLLREHHAPALAFAVTGLLGQASEWTADDGGAALPLLDADGLRALERAQVAIGVHTRTHPMLDRLAPDQVREEIERSVADIEALGLRRPSLMAYPYGANNTEVLRAVAATGLAGAFTTAPGIAKPGGNPVAIPRIEILRADGMLRFAWKVITGRRGRRRR